MTSTKTEVSNPELRSIQERLNKTGLCAPYDLSAKEILSIDNQTLDDILYVKEYLKKTLIKSLQLLASDQTQGGREILRHKIQEIETLEDQIEIMRTIRDFSL
jgi:DNA polymerase III delta prime subunit